MKQITKRRFRYLSADYIFVGGWLLSMIGFSCTITHPSGDWENCVYGRWCALMLVYIGFVVLLTRSLYYTPVQTLTFDLLWAKKQNKQNKLNCRISECVNWDKIISSYDTFFVLGVKFDIFGFGYFGWYN